MGRKRGASSSPNTMRTRRLWYLVKRGRASWWTPYRLMNEALKAAGF
jgi:hypothetical protein